MKIALAGLSDKIGGAARATWRLYECLHAVHQPVVFGVIFKTSDDQNVLRAAQRRWHLGWKREQLWRAAITFKNTIYHSFNLCRSPLLHTLNQTHADIIHLNWIGSGALAIKDLPRLKAKQLVWTLHDEWAYSGAEHYHLEGCANNHIIGYTNTQMPLKDRLINRWVWWRKKRAYRKIASRLHIIAPSHWISDQVKKSPILKPASIHVIPYALDLNIFRLQDKTEARKTLQLPLHKKIILFGAMSPESNPIKGYHHLISALSNLKTKDCINDLHLCIFGGHLQPDSELDGFPIHSFGHIDDDRQLALLYAAADVMVVPSVMDNAPQTITEAQACGTPVIAFSVGGIPDYIIHGQTGYLAKPYDTADLANGIEYVLNLDGSLRTLCRNAVASFSYPIIADRHITLYRDILGLNSLYNK